MDAPDDQEEAARLLRRLLEAVEKGELDASSSSGRRLLRRVEGAISALEFQKRQKLDPQNSKKLD